MKQLDINSLIEKYFRGDTSPEEDNVLKTFLSNNTDEKYADLRLQFQLMDNVFKSNDELNNSFDEMILEQISAAKPIKRKQLNIKTLSGIAATIIIFFSIWAATNILGTKEVYGTINDPKVAFAEAKMILQKVSGNVKKGIAPATKTIKKADDGLKKSKKINNIKSLNNTGLLLKSMTTVTVKYGKS